MFLKNHTKNVVEKLVTDPFLKNWNWAYIWINSLTFYAVCFCWIASWGLSKYFETKLHLVSPHIKLLWKIKRSLELVSLPHFLHNFWRKIFLLLCSVNWPNVIVYFFLLCEILSNICIAIVCKPGCDVLNFEVNLIFLIKLFFQHEQNVVTKT